MALCSCTPGLLRLVHGFLLLAFFFRLPAAVLSEDGSCNQLNFVVTAKREVHIARQKETAGEGWYASEVPSARSFLQSPNLQACVRDIAGKLRTKSANCTAEAQGGSDACLSAEASQGLDRRSMGVLEWLHELLSLPFMRSLLRGQELKPFGSISSAYASLKESKAVKFEHSDEDVTRATERLQQLLFDEEYGSMRPKPRRTSEGVPVMEPSLKHMTRDTLQIPRMGAVVVGGQHNELQLEVIAAPAQQRPVFQISRAEDAILRVGPTGEMQVRGSLTVLNTQDAVSTGNSALVSAGGLSVAKNAVVGGRLQVEETQDASPSGAGALQVAGGLAVGKRAFFGGTVTIGRKNGDSGPRLLKVESMDDEAAVVVQSGTWEKPPLIELWASGGESRPLVASLSNQNGSLVMGAGSSGFRMQGGPLLVADESDAALKENGRVGASVLTKGGLGVAKGLHVGSDISIGKGPSQRTYPGRSLRIASPTGPSEVLLQPGAKSASRVQFGRAAVIEGINNAIEIIAGPADNLADGSSQGNWRSKGSIQLTAGANEGVQVSSQVPFLKVLLPLFIEMSGFFGGMRLLWLLCHLTLQPWDKSVFWFHRHLKVEDSILPFQHHGEKKRESDLSVNETIRILCNVFSFQLLARTFPCSREDYPRKNPERWWNYFAA